MSRRDAGVVGGLVLILLAIVAFSPVGAPIRSAVMAGSGISNVKPQTNGAYLSKLVLVTLCDPIGSCTVDEMTYEGPDGAKSPIVVHYVKPGTKNCPKWTVPSSLFYDTQDTGIQSGGQDVSVTSCNVYFTLR